MRKVLLLIVCLFQVYNLHAMYVIETGQTLNVDLNNPYFFLDGILIEDGGVLNFDGGLIHMGPGTEIRIEAGGQITGNDGDVQALVTGQYWQGIVVDPISSAGINNIPAIHVANISIRGAINGISSEANNGPIPRLILDNVLFSNNRDYNLYMRSSLDYDNGSIITNGTFFPADNAGWWPNHIGGVRNVKIQNCVFNGGRFALHFDHAEEIVILDCHFNDYTGAGLSLHYSITDAYVARCIFDSKHADTDGIEFTEIPGSHVDDVLIARNTFRGREGGVAINTEDLASFTNVRINRNKILDAVGGGNGYDVGMYIQNAFSGPNQIYRNSIVGCQTGIVFNENNSSMQLSCNQFVNNGDHIRIFGKLANQIYEGGRRYDPHNYFDSGANHDIENLSGLPFTYYYSWQTDPVFWPTNSDNVTLTQVVAVWCYNNDPVIANLPETPEDKTMIYPNPSTDHFSLNNLPTGAKQVMVSDLMGRALQQFEIVEDADYPVDDLTDGTYILRVLNSKGEALHSSLFVVDKLAGQFTR